MQDASKGNEATANTATPEPVLEFGEQRIRVVSLPQTFVKPESLKVGLATWSK